MKGPIADVCILCEGSYPYSVGGVAQWVHELICEQKERTFHIISLAPPHPNLTFQYTFPPNVIGHTTYIVQNLPKGASPLHTPPAMWARLKPLLKTLLSNKLLKDFSPLFALVEEYRPILGKKILFESEESWDFILEIYKETIPSGPFKSYFATIYTLLSSLFSLLIPPLPQAKVFHAVCTGYAGLLLHRAKIEQKAACMLTEHGIYLNERRIEIAISEWIVETGALNLAIQDKKNTLKDFWLHTFSSFGTACYQSADEVICTFDGNQELQLQGGADPKKMQTIVHGIKPCPPTSHQENRPQTVAFIGRVVPIKDVKTFIRACHIVHQDMPHVQFYILGPSYEDPGYAEECKKLANALGISSHVQFLGTVSLPDYFPKIDVVVLTSISEAQPLTLLEAGAVGIPSVATQVGACEQILYGNPDEDPPLGQGGILTPLVNPEATAQAIVQLLSDPVFYQNCSHAIRQRIQTYYRYEQQQEAYRKLYTKYIGM